MHFHTAPDLSYINIYNIYKKQFSLYTKYTTVYTTLFAQQTIAIGTKWIRID